ncbi:MAG: hypothetical protein H0W25_07650 [Acidimicrobiia bacterium]|nr:hypothetical protein [Acidimicrobiia bacterium]
MHRTRTDSALLAVTLAGALAPAASTSAFVPVGNTSSLLPDAVDVGQDR